MSKAYEQTMKGDATHRLSEPLALIGLNGAPEPLEVNTRHRLTEALGRVVELYDGWGKPDEAAKWRKELEQALKLADSPRRE